MTRLAWLALLLACLAAPVRGQDIGVVSGAHPGFDRLVFDLGGRRPWRLAREAGGYVLLLPGSGARFDLSRAFDRIRRGRIAGLVADAPAALRLRIACACHADAFDYGDDLLVIDIRDGAPPPDSPFEGALDGARADPLPAMPPGPPAASSGPAGLRRVEGYDWLSQYVASPARPETAEGPELHSDTRAATRAALIARLARGGAAGSVDLVARLPLADGAPASPLGAQITVTVPPGAASPAHGAGVAATTAPRHTAQGIACLAGPDVAAWGDPRPVAHALGPVSVGLAGEFDRPSAEAAARAIRYRLYLGFGAEARQLIAAFAPDHPEAEIWRSLSRIVEGEAPPPGPFQGMADCDTPAALWAFMTSPAGATAPVETAAVLRAFSALPPHLRQVLGPALADRFMARGNRAAARTVHDAYWRGNPAGDARGRLMSAALQRDDPVARDATLHPLRASPGPEGAEALAAAVAAHLARDESVPDTLAAALEARLQEAGGPARAPDLGAAAAGAAASRGEYDRAFALAESLPQAAPTVWSILAQRSDDSALLRHAIAPPRDAALADAPTRARLARRLLDQGFPEAALAWLAAAPDAGGDTDRALLAAEIDLRRRDPAASAARLAGVSGAPAEQLRRSARALRQSGLPLGAADPAMPEALERAAARRARDWPGVARADDAVWAAAAAALLGDTAPSTGPAAPPSDAPPADAPPTTDPPPGNAAAETPVEGPLAAGRRLVGDSAAARARLEALLAATEITTAPDAPASR